MSHILDARFLGYAWTTQELSGFFSDEARFQRWLDIEAVLAEAEGELGIIPAEAARAIAENARFSLFDGDFIRASYTETGHSLVPVLRALERQCPPGTGEYIHFGATTQDILDTELVLSMRHIWKILMRDCLRLETILLKLASRYRITPMAARTQCQQALPITAGLKFAGFAAELRRDIERLKDFSRRGFVLMLHGAVGTMAGFGPQALELREKVAAKLGLAVPPVVWNNARDNVGEFQTVMGLAAGTLMRMANAVCTLGHTEIHELTEPLDPGKVGSSTMPHKRNPQRSSMVVAMGHIVQANVQLALQAQCVEHERDTRTWRLDWHSIPESSLLLAKMLENMLYVFGDLGVHEDSMLRNLDALGGMLLSEAVMFELGKTLGKQTAHHILRRAVQQCGQEYGRFRECILAQPEVAGKLSPERLAELTDCANYLGFAGEEVDRTIAFCRECAKSDAEAMEKVR